MSSIKTSTDPFQQAYEMLTRKPLFSPVEGDGFTRDEHHLALMLALTKETFTPLIEASSKRDIYFDEQGTRKSIETIVIADSTLGRCIPQGSYDCDADRDD
jgi:hypothetical protein